MKKILISVLMLIMLATGCSGTSRETSSGNGNGGVAADGCIKSTGTGEASATGIQYFPSYNPEYETVRNEAFDFWFDIPKNWKAVDNSKDGTLYSIISDNINIKMTAYGILKDGSEEDFYKKLAGSGGNIADFDFRDGWTGKKIENSDSKVYYVRLDGDSYICFCINYKNDPGWYGNNAELLNNVAMSFRTRQESFGRDAGSGDKITLDDLKLGDIAIDMPCDKAVKAVKAKLLKEEKDKLTGMDSKTLYFSDDTQIYIADGTVYTVNVVSSDYATPRGLKVGDPKSKVTKLYGEPDNTSDSTHWGYTYQGYELFSIILKDGKVAEIQIDMVM